MNMLKCSHRKYHILGFEEGIVVDIPGVSIDVILRNAQDLELFNSIGEETDRLLDLAVGEGMLDWCGRDAKRIGQNQIMVLRTN